jgi:hypothetical protein
LAVRFLIYAQNPSLWFDEILVALNVATRSYLHLGVLRFDQAAPPLYLWLVRLCVDVFGVHEASLRLPSLMAGAALLVLTAVLAFEAAGPYAAALATAIAALSANLCRYSDELKPYGMDAAVSAVLLLLAWPVLANGGSRARRITLAACGVASVFLSMPAIFVLAGIAAALLVSEWRRSRAVWIVAVSAAWAGSFLAAYKLFYAAADSPYMQRFWAGAKLGPSSGVAKAASAIGNALMAPALGDSDISLVLAIAGTALFAVGIRALWRSHGLPGVTLFCGPLGLAALAMLLGKWMPAVRLMLFTAPVVCVVIGMGAWEAASWTPKAMRARVFWALSAVLLLAPLRHTVYRVRHPELEANREAVDACLRHAKAGDVVYVYPRSTAAWVFYSTDWSAPDRGDTERMMAAIERSGPNAGNRESRHGPVVNEGSDWRFMRNGRVELFGVPTGIRSTAVGNTGEPDPGWANNEVDRMLAQDSAGRIWIVATSYQQPALDGLRRELNARQLTQSAGYSGEWAQLYRIMPMGP